ncbi:Sequestosome-1 [Orchesella cincta]|uniref:Sequestosome-1 n=1 Tax=Orchesella cincta TaxID=48709 RepID=A0A1D2NFZ8_ORCCI|nr:Sequestosome-1 [Orchesella cincta]
MDFGPFGIGVAPEQLQQFRMFMAQQHQQQQQPPSQPKQGASNQPGEGDAGQRGSEQPQQNSERPQGQSGNDSGDAQQQQGDSPVLMHNAAHSGVICDICNSEIKGFRYKCMQCPDFDLCSKCEHKGHHAGHVMMRISFPEQTRDAIRKYLSNCPPSPPPHGRHGHGHHGHHHGPHPFAGPQGPEGFPFVFGRRPHCGRRGQGHGHSQEQNSGSDDERPATAPGCPYNMGKKEFKKWSKWVKRAAQHQHRSAEAYARAAAAAGENGGPAASASTGAAAAPECPVDFQAVASQIQEFLNYFGIPVDVVELYDQLGNGGQSNAAQNQQSTSQGTTTGEQTQTSTGTQQGSANATATNTGPSTQEQQPASPAAANLSENMQQMRIDEVQNGSGPQDESLLMDLDAENSGWTILNNQSREQTPSNTAPVAAPESQQPSAPQGPDAANNANGSPQGTPTGSINSNNGNGNNTPFASMGSNSSIGKSAAAPSAPSYPSGIPNVPLYPVLNQPQIQQILQNVSSAVNSVVRSIPIVADPRGPVGTNVTSATNGQVPATGTETSDGQDVQLDARCMKTLNQLLAMGFSNEGGYLTRLVIAKNGDLEAVLGSLFPN